MSTPQPPEPSAPQQPLSDSDARLWAMLGQLSGIILGFVGSLIIMLVFGPRSAFVKKESTEALNFQITVTIAYVVSFILMFILIGFVLFLAVWILNIVFCIIAGMKNNQGLEYRYPLTFRFVK
ncbi:MAG: DUF4870 domain-containing protein [Candidatus Nanopelagicales bacterium]|jgi:uncharacterized protein|nr:DUF4870 domain-containing protein [Candidatus Nanopelagicales bacterium]MDP4714267.1 DUF4870 domain-containing protein [Candidatus Nanopelagicales bacterium]MDP4905732.1 DUF4870 domain-containing protein [Candidatus Nanopelagicales bacterium]MDP4975102.1 DUF4870 domain-containing protein [Candidatus Nanopelagicales bacterium]MDP5095583.1 DUF4870 domain-containing protein [Candidatus Nanopelagicales bacterium]